MELTTINIPVTSEPVMLRQQVSALPAYVSATWQTRYVPSDGVDLEARALLDREAAAVRGGGIQPDARAVWMRLADKVVRAGSPPPELVAAAALAGLSAGVRPQGFNAPDMKPATLEAD